MSTCTYTRTRAQKLWDGNREPPSLSLSSIHKKGSFLLLLFLSRVPRNQPAKWVAEQAGKHWGKSFPPPPPLPKASPPPTSCTFFLRQEMCLLFLNDFQKKRERERRKVTMRTRRRRRNRRRKRSSPVT